MEIPTDDEIFDNVVAYWVPSPLPEAGQERELAYTLHWVKDEPTADIGRVMHTRVGRGGIPGQPRPPDRVKFVIDFNGGPLALLAKSDKVEPVVTLSRGKVTHKYALQIVGSKAWRAVFDVQADVEGPLDLRMFLKKGDKTLTETWLYQYHFKKP